MLIQRIVQSFLFGVAIATSAAAVAQGATRSSVWVLHNEDPDFRNPPFGDFLRLYSPSGEILASIEDFNIAQYIGAPRLLSTTLDGGAVASDFVNEVLRRFDSQGEEVFSVPIDDITAIAVSATGSMFGLAGPTIHGAEILKIDSDGNVVTRTEGGGIDLVVDDSHQALWAVGSTIQRYSLDLALDWSMDPIAWSAVSVDIAEDGSAWIAERRHSHVSGSVDRLLQVSQEGVVLQEVNAGYSPWCIRIDSTGNLWVAGGSLNKYDSAGNHLMSTPEIGVWSLAIDPSGSGVWAGCDEDVKYYDLEGNLLITLPPFGHVDRTWVSSGPILGGRPRFRRGDCNDDGRVDISDAVCILNWLFLGGPIPGCVAVANTNGDVGADISDASYLLNYLFIGGPPPIHPFPDCGPGTLPTDEETCQTPPEHCPQ